MNKASKKKPVIFVLFGATGDLARKKIFPALESLHKSGAFAPGSDIKAVSRREWDDARFAEFLREFHKDSFAPGFFDMVSYSNVDIEKDAGYEGLARDVRAAQKAAPSAETIFYLSLAPRHHALVFTALVKAGLLSRGGAKLLIEKPFGTDEKSARALDKLFLSELDESQILRMDHYLGKDSVRAIMDLHESTPDFDRLVSKESVASIRVRLHERQGIEGRGATYDDVGAFRDVGQNHMLEMVASVAAELWDGKMAKSWQAARAEVFEHLAPPAKTCDLSRRGQYEGYLFEKGVKAGSDTETAFEVQAALSSGKLKGVPIILEAGKMMPQPEASVEIAFKEISGMPKFMRFFVQPEQKISIENRDGTRDEFEIPKSGDAYENIMRAAISGSSREFVGSREIEALWRYADHVVACWSKVPLETYSEKDPFRFDSFRK